jgi:3-hydroxyacyl-[acyl-carrier-protein] dehydratase
MTSLDIDQILQILPHRHPLLMVDGVTDVQPDRILAFKCVSYNEPQFAGHFPGVPVLPAVLILEALAQTGVLLAHHCGAFDPKLQLAYFMTVDRAKFRAPVRPGDRLELEVVPQRKGSSVWKMQGTARVGQQVVATADFAAMITPRDRKSSDAG